MKPKILVTGADGFIGSHLTESLIQKGYKVKAFTFYNSFNSWGWLDYTSKKYLDKIEVVSGDIRDIDCVNKALKGCDLVFHLAALVGIPFSYHAPETYIDTNIKGTLNVLRAALNSKKVRVIHTSTSEVYGTAKFTPITEDHPLQGQSPYSASKIGADQLVLSFYKSYGLPVSIIRPFNTFGPRQSLRAIIPTIITQILNNNKIINLGNLNPSRNFNFVSDTVDGFISTIKKEKINGEVINIGSEFEITIKETAELIAKILNKKIIINLDKKRVRPKNSEVDKLQASSIKAKKLLNWKPKYSNKNGFIKALKSTIEWYKNPSNLKKFK